jgi:UDP-N-acetyl-2-amino-2-deoxyglucuronate dehydrogenase
VKKAPGKPLGIGLIGCGDIAPTHAKALQAATGAKLVSCADTVEASAKSLGEEYGVTYTTDVADLIADPQVEAVTLATPAFTHADLAEAAAKAGKAVLCEKPLAADLPDADRMIRACAEAGVALATCFPLRYLGAARWIGKLVAAGALGEIIEIRMRNLGEKKETYWTGGFSGRTKTDWRKVRALSGGGVVITNLIHHIDLVRAITRLEVKRAFGEMGTFVTEVEVEDVATACLRYENDAIGLVEGASCFLGGSDEYPVSLLGTKGQARFHLWGGKSEVFLTEGYEGLPAGEWVKREHEDATHAQLYNEFAAAVRAGKRPPITGEDGRKALEIVLAIYRSADLGQPVALPL